jgi:hypothetical protein
MSLSRPEESRLLPPMTTAFSGEVRVLALGLRGGYLILDVDS